MAETPPLEKEEYEMQFYGSTVSELFDELKLPFTDALEDTFQSLMNAIEKNYCKSESYKKIFDERVKEAAPKAISEMKAHQARHLKKLQYMVEEKIFKIPDHVVLPEDICQVQFEPKKAGKINDEIDMLIARVEKVQLMKEAITREIQAHNEVFGYIKGLVDHTEDNLNNVKSVLTYEETLKLFAKIEKNFV